MGAVIVVLVLAGLLLPISMLLLAVAFDVLVGIWAAYRMWHDSWAPRIVRGFRHAHLPHLMRHHHR